MEASKPPDAGRIAFLDYLRIFAFLSVLAGHKFYAQLLAFTADESVHVTPRLIVSWLLPLCYGGAAGVVVFFHVSGYIIAHVLQTEHAGEFVVKRFFRIYPLFAVAVLLEYATTARPDAPQSLRDWVLQLLLLGDFANVPYALAGVEWTLRIEVLFYVFMGLLRAMGLMERFRGALPWALVGAVLALGIAPPFPSGGELFTAYLTLYGPFLLVGVAFRLKETGDVGGAFLVGFTVLVFCQYFTLIDRYQSFWKAAHFAGLAFLLFATCWGFRRHIVATPLVLFVSDLTYAVYLFHNWVYELVIETFGATAVRPEVVGLVGLFVVCVLANRCVEKPGVRVGRAVLKRLPRRGPVRLVFRRLPLAVRVS